MVWVRRFWLKLQSLCRRNRNAQQLDEEIQFHIEQQIAVIILPTRPWVRVTAVR